MPNSLPVHPGKTCPMFLLVKLTFEISTMHWKQNSFLTRERMFLRRRRRLWHRKCLWHVIDHALGKLSGGCGGRWCWWWWLMWGYCKINLMNPFVEGIYVTYNFRHVSLQYTNNNAVKHCPSHLGNGQISLCPVSYERFSVTMNCVRQRKNCISLLQAALLIFLWND